MREIIAKMVIDDKSYQKSTNTPIIKTKPTNGSMNGSSNANNNTNNQINTTMSYESTFNTMKEKQKVHNHWDLF